jgi:cytochrome c oxidase subunit 1
MTAITRQPGDAGDSFEPRDVEPLAPGAIEAAQFERSRGLLAWATSTDHKRIALLTMATSLVFLCVFGILALIMRTQLAQPNSKVVSPDAYNELFTLHGSGMIFLVLTPLAIGLCLYLVPLQIGAPMVAAPRLCLFSYWLYVAGAAVFLLSATTVTTPPNAGWYAYMPLSDGQYTPGAGMSLWILASMLAVGAMMLMAGAVLWTALRMRAPGLSLMRMSVFTWSAVVTCLMTVASFPSLLGAMGLQWVGRFDPNLFTRDSWDIAYQYLFWFYGHPVVYVMFFPFVGCVAEVLAAFTGRKYFGYSFTVYALLAFAAGSMAVFGHHTFTTGQTANDYFSVTSIMLSVPAGVEYFGFLGTLMGGRIRTTVPMLFALAFIPQFLIGGLTGIMLATPVLDYHFHGSYFVVAHFHYTLFAGSLFGAFAGLYYWFPKATGIVLSEPLGRLNFVLMVIGTNVTFLPMFFNGFDGLPRRVATYPAGAGFGTLNLISTVGAFIIGISVMVFVFNVARSAILRRPAGDDPWDAGQTLEWATSSPPPRFNFDAAHPIPPIKSHAPLLDLRQRSGASSG